MKKSFLKNDNGSATIEMSVIMGTLIIIIYMVIILFLYMLDIAAVKKCVMCKVVTAGDGYEDFYKESLEQEIKEELADVLFLSYIEEIKFFDELDDVSAEVTVNIENKILQNKQIIVKVRTRKNQREKNLRRRELFGV